MKTIAIALIIAAVQAVELQSATEVEGKKSDWDIDALLPQYLALSAELALKLSDDLDEPEDVEFPEVDLDEIAMPDVDLDEVEMPSFSFEAPKMDLNLGDDIEIPDVDLEEPDLPSMPSFDLKSKIASGISSKVSETLSKEITDIVDVQFDDALADLDFEAPCLAGFDDGCDLEDDDEESDDEDDDAKGVWVKKVNGVTTMCLPDALEGCVLQLDLDIENGVLEFTQVPKIDDITEELW